MFAALLMITEINDDACTIGFEDEVQHSRDFLGQRRRGLYHLGGN